MCLIKILISIFPIFSPSKTCLSVSEGAVHVLNVINTRVYPKVSGLSR
jgi:hypothetical protein